MAHADRQGVAIRHEAHNPHVLKFNGSWCVDRADASPRGWGWLGLTTPIPHGRGLGAGLSSFRFMQNDAAL